MNLETFMHDRLRISSVYAREWMAEFLGTYILICFGCGVNAQTTLSRGKAGEFLSVNFGWALGITFGVFASGTVSGGHINPAVSLAMVIFGRMHVKKLLIYWTAQYLGAILGSACVFGVYYDALNAYDGGVRSVTGENATAGIWGTYPQAYLTTLSGLGDQVFGTMLLVMSVMAVTDSRNNMQAHYIMTPLYVGLIVLVIGISFGLNCGFAINPARDLGPRIFTAIAGWGREVFTAYRYWFWVPIVGPHIGALCGALIYMLLIGIHLEEPAEEMTYDEDKQEITLSEPERRRTSIWFSNSDTTTTAPRERRMTIPLADVGDTGSDVSSPPAPTILFARKTEPERRRNSIWFSVTPSTASKDRRPTLAPVNEAEPTDDDDERPNNSSSAQPRKSEDLSEGPVVLQLNKKRARANSVDV